MIPVSASSLKPMPPSSMSMVDEPIFRQAVIQETMKCPQLATRAPLADVVSGDRKPHEVARALLDLSRPPAISSFWIEGVMFNNEDQPSGFDNRRHQV